MKSEKEEMPEELDVIKITVVSGRAPYDTACC